MKQMRKILLLTALAWAPAVFAISGKTMLHYVAYDAAFWPKSLPVTPENYSRVALDGMLNRRFDTLVFAPVFSFGSMAAKLSSADYVKIQPGADVKWLVNQRNGMDQLVKAGGDPIALTCKWCRQHKKEAVVALPVNIANTHQNIPTKDRPNTSWYSYLWSAWKSQNPDAVMNFDGKTGVRYSSNYMVDYTVQKVRDKYTAIACEIAGKYDIDGIMVDFMMAPSLFRSVATGGVASAKEVEYITAMLTKIKAACTAAAGRLGHPVAFSARLPDSLGYCKDIGINLPALLEAKMFDYVVLGGTFQLQTVKDSAAMMAKSGIPYYMSYTVSGIYVGNDSGYTGDDERIPRQSAPTMRARIQEAILNKAAGCMYTMHMHHDHAIPVHAQVAYDVKGNKYGDKRYFVCYTNDRLAGNYLQDWQKYRTHDSLLSGSAIDLAKGVAKRSINVWDDFNALKGEGKLPETQLIIEALIPSGMDTIVSFNGKELKSYKRRAGTQLYKLPAGLCKYGANEVIVKSKGKNKRGGTVKLGNIAVEVKFPKEGK